MNNIPRGFRNNNPFNIRRSGSKWIGLVPDGDKDFCVFENLQFGLRAGLKLLINYVRKGYNTPSKIIERFAPSLENNTKNYISFVVRVTSLDADYRITKYYQLVWIAYAIIMYENGRDFVVNNLYMRELFFVLDKFNLNKKEL